MSLIHWSEAWGFPRLLFIKKEFERRKMGIIETVNEIIDPLLIPLDYELYDVELNGGILKVTITSDEGITIDELAKLNREISSKLDEEDLIKSKYTLEVSSPGLERKLRREEHYFGAISERISVKLGPHVEGERRHEGELLGIDEMILNLKTSNGSEIKLNLSDITSAKTVYEWEKNPKPGSKISASGIS